MATITEPSVEELNLRSNRLEAKTRELWAEANELTAEQPKVQAERDLMPRAPILQAMIAFAAVLGAGAALAKFFP